MSIPLRNLQVKLKEHLRKKELERNLQVRKRQISELTDVENMQQHNVDTLQDDIEHLFNERSRLQQFVSGLKIVIGGILK